MTLISRPATERMAEKHIEGQKIGVQWFLMALEVQYYRTVYRELLAYIPSVSSYREVLLDGKPQTVVVVTTRTKRSPSHRCFDCLASLPTRVSVAVQPVPIYVYISIHNRIQT